MDRSDAARGRLAISHDLIWNEHGLFCGGGETSLPGLFGGQGSNAMMSASVEAFCSKLHVSQGIQDLRTLFAPRGGSATSLSRARGRVS